MQVRDLLTTDHEQQLKAQGKPGPASSLKRDAAKVDAFVSTIGFPLVGGPAGKALLQRLPHCLGRTGSPPSAELLVSHRSATLAGIRT